VKEIAGELFDARTSRSRPAVLKDRGHGNLELKWEKSRSFYKLASLKISSRLGNTPRYITMSDGRKFETRDNDAIDALLAQNNRQGWQAFLHRLESRLHYVAIAFFVVVGFLWATYQYGLPAASEAIAFSMPAGVTNTISGETLSYLDKQVFRPSKLPEQTQQRLQMRFSQIVAPIQESHQFKLLFRTGGEVLGANAFALPSGIVVMTDELVALAQNDDELVAILAHEVGHVVNRHGLRQTLQSSILGLFVSYATGDFSSVVLALPVLLVELGYSRDFEHEADDYAYQYLVDNRIDTISFANILNRLERSHRQRSDMVEKNGKVMDVFKYLSTHPETSERVKRFEEGSKNKNS
jgi:Zn-dependent protease with chaperone function